MRKSDIELILITLREARKGLEEKSPDRTLTARKHLMRAELEFERELSVIQ